MKAKDDEILELIQAMAKVLRMRGALVFVYDKLLKQDDIIHVNIIYSNKRYNFTDPDLAIIFKQMQKLDRTIYQKDCITKRSKT